MVAIAGAALGGGLLQHGSLVGLHKAVGVGVILLGVVQVSAILLRPDKVRPKP